MAHLIKKTRRCFRPTSILTTRPTCLNRGSADFPTCRRVEVLPRSRMVQHIRHGVSRGFAEFPLLSKTEAVRASRTHTKAQTSLSRGPHYPTSTRIEAGPFRRSLISEKRFTHYVQQSPHCGTELSVGPLPPVWGGVTPTAKVRTPA